MKQIQKSTKDRLMPIALMVLVFGIIGSLYFLFKTARNQSSVVLLALFTFWVISPYAGLFIAYRISKSWVASKRAYFYWLMIVIAVCSSAAYSGVFTPAGTKPAFIFLVIPPISWLMIFMVFIVVRKSSKMVNRHRE